MSNDEFQPISFDPLQSQTSSTLPGGMRNTSKAKSAAIARAVQLIFSAYRSSEYADPDGFVVQLGAVLGDFPLEVVEYISSPRTGIQRRSKWPPTLSEVISACEEHQDHLRRKSQPVRMALPLSSPKLLAEREPGEFAQVHVPQNHPRYEKLCEWAKTAAPIWWKHGMSSDKVPGIWVSWKAWEEGGSTAPHN